MKAADNGHATFTERKRYVKKVRKLAWQTKAQENNLVHQSAETAS
jgi:hypothetical protein